MSKDHSYSLIECFMCGKDPSHACVKCEEYICTDHSKEYGCCDNQNFICDDCVDAISLERVDHSRLFCRKIACNCKNKTSHFGDVCREARRLLKSFIEKEMSESDRLFFKKISKGCKECKGFDAARLLVLDPSEFLEYATESACRDCVKKNFKTFAKLSKIAKDMTSFIEKAPVLLLRKHANDYASSKELIEKKAILARVIESNEFDSECKQILTRNPDFLLLVAVEYPPIKK
jgi:hypothetical protein